MEAKCKICGVPLDLSIDPEYDTVGDRNRLMPMATCNRCGDMRSKRESYHDDFYRQCVQLIVLTPSKNSEERRQSYKVSLLILARKYAKLIAAYHRSSLVIPVEDLVSDLMDKPKHWADALRAFRRHVRTVVREERERQPALPHND